MSQPPQPFRALHVAYQLIESLGPVIPVIRKHDASLADQLRRAAQSVALGSKRNPAWRSGRQSA
ncbi:MAG: hypothetical protein H6721_01205 [Sandaracinus sp.]|nr:hypothetical protein [Sandaracinus sp.]